MSRGPAGLCCVLVGLTALAAGCSSGNGEGGAGSQAESRLYVNPNNNAVAGAAQLDQEGRGEEAARIRERIASQPTAKWFGVNVPSLEQDVRDFVTGARAADATPVVVAYFIPSRDCGGFSGGGAASADQYRSWIDRFADGIGPESAIVILEPDALPHTIEDCADRAEERYALLNYAIDSVRAHPGARAYLDAGNASWIDDTAVLAEALKDAGVMRAAGFALNTANFESTPDSIAYGERISRILGGVHFVVNTSRNGNGAFGNDESSWCNPPGRALGDVPTLDTGRARVDAFLWVKQPGDSDGECRGGPPAGDWWPENALELVGAG